MFSTGLRSDYWAGAAGRRAPHTPPPLRARRPSSPPARARHTPGSADCGFDFNVGDQYLVYAYDYTGALTTNICLRTAELSQAAADLAYLQSRTTLPVTQAASPLPVACLAGAALLLGLVALTAGGLWFARRRGVPPT